MYAATQRLLEVLNNEIGYLEKKSNSQLDDKTANAGYNNFTKYARDMKSYGAYSIQGCAWCDGFADWALVQAVGIQKAYELLGGWSAYTPTSASYYKKMGRWFETNPQVGDQIFFKNTQRICHTGWVVEVTDKYVYTIEGNTSGGSDVISNGGGVCKKKYAHANTRIAGYGRPDWASTEKVTLADVQNQIKQALNIIPNVDGMTLKDVQENLKKALNITTGAPDTTPSVSKTYLSKGDKGEKVRQLQTNLNKVMQSGLAVDGDFGAKTKAAVIAFQKKYGLTQDGKFGVKSSAKMDEVLAQINTQPATPAQPAAPQQPAQQGNPVIQMGQGHANGFAQCGIATDGIRGPKTKQASVKVLQRGMNLDYKAGLVEDGDFGPKSEKALGTHSVRYGETQYMVTALEILLMLKGYNPNGLELPGKFGSGVKAATEAYQRDNGLTVDGIAGPKTFKSLIS